MKRSDKAVKIAAMLEEFYPETPVPLDHENNFQLLVAVLMSAQTVSYTHLTLPTILRV